MVFSTNQANQVYVASAYKAKLAENDAVGTIAVLATPDSDLYFQHIGAGGITRSDLINNIIRGSVTDAKAVARKLKTATVTLDSNINGGKPVAGQDYVLNILFNQVISLSEEDTYTKTVSVRATSGMTASNFYKALGIALALNLSKEATKLVGIYLKTSEGLTEVTSFKEADYSGTYTGVVIKEAVREWIRGRKSTREIPFTVHPTTIMVDTDELVWGSVAYGTDGQVKSGPIAADLEYFLMGERADKYRGMGYPDEIPTTYLVDPNKEYNMIGIHYAYIGSNEGVQKSEKDITILVEKESDGSNTLTNQIIGAINTKVGKTLITTLASASTLSD